jgi:hypothetical protein
LALQLLRLIFTLTLAAAALTAKEHFFPGLFPLFAPGERPAAVLAKFTGEMLFFDAVHE